MIKSFSIAHYSALAIGFLIRQDNADSQVIYTDIEPDIILDGIFDLAGVDMDNNGTYDFAFLKVLYATFTFPFYDYYSYIQKIWCGPYGTPANAVAGTSPDVQYYPYALSSGDTINDDLKFYNWGYQRMAARTSDEFGWQHHGGHWYPEVLDHYLGVRFIDDEAQDHYGWIRCSVTDTGRVLIIKDYAYELQPDWPIIAGSTESYVPLAENENTGNISVYSFSNTIYINTSEAFGSELSISVFDITGKLIQTKHSNLQHIELVMHVSGGIYFVEVISEENRFCKKVFLH